MKRILIMILAALLLGGCAAGLSMFGSGAGIAVGTGVDHTLRSITYRTFSTPMGALRRATLKTLRRMDIAVRTDSPTAEGREIVAAARGRMIEIAFEALSRRTTRMRVVASKGFFLKDRATATEIIAQTAETLDRQPTAARTPG